MDVLADHLIYGLTRGAEYALMAAGMALIFGVARIVNFAHGEFYMVGAYLMYLLQSNIAAPYPVLAIVAVVGMAGFGALYYGAVVYRSIGVGWANQIVATLAASILLANLAVVLAGPIPKSITSPYLSVLVTIGSTTVSLQRIIVLACAIVSFVGLYLLLSRTKYGKAMRALSQNRDACVVLGIPVHRMGMLAVVIGSALAGVAGTTIPVLSNVNPAMGALLTIKAFAAVIMGGLGNVTGAIISALFLGVVEALAVGYVSSAYGDAFVFGVLVAVLLVRPAGVFGRAVRVS
ncbi:MAG: branched-chain amino acid ABC transporter permease [Acidimicrobiales bacterium]